MTDKLFELKVDGMDCANCASSINRYLSRKGLEDVYVNFQTKEVRFRLADSGYDLEKAKAGIQKLGFTVLEEDQPSSWWNLKTKLIIASVFTIPLLINHFLMMSGVIIPWLDNTITQLLLCLPVFAIGIEHFGQSAFKSIKSGVPNMDVLVFIGSTAAFIYSLIGTYLGEGQYIFFETSATIITFVLAGNWLEHRAIESTTTAIKSLTALQAEQAKKIMPSGTVITISKEEIKVGDILLVTEGEKIPTDGRLIEGNASVDESMMTGESLPVDKKLEEELIGGTIILNGNLQMVVTAVGKNTLLQQMIELVKTAQQDKPDIQRLADKISAIFVPAVLAIAVLTVLIATLIFQIPFSKALMNGIAVLVISCPCAMGLATPTAVMVGVGRMARMGILVRGGQTLEILSKVKHIVFDKTGTLTSGKFKIKEIKAINTEQEHAHQLIYQLEKHSSHPIALSLVKHLETLSIHNTGITLKVREQKGMGMFGEDEMGNQYQLGSKTLLNGHYNSDWSNYQLFLLQNEELIAAVSLEDDLREDASDLVDYLHSENIETSILSGDTKEKTAKVAETLSIKHQYGEHKPAEKLKVIEKISQSEMTAMIGDGINDAPALAKADLGISLGNASQIAIQSAQVVLLKGELKSLQEALVLSKHTVLTIKQNLFWAFIYNIVAIPIAALGFLNPMWGALFMAFSDIVVIGNSVRLNYKKLPNIK
ncbi:MAG: cation-translocating P-type ATPase [Bacteroidota bacterium]